MDAAPIDAFTPAIAMLDALNKRQVSEGQRRRHHGRSIRLHHLAQPARNLSRVVAGVLSRVGCGASPANIVPAFPHTGAPFQQRTLIINGVTVPYSRQSVYAGIATLAGQPATAFPVGMTRTGLPIGLQAIGPYLEDFKPIRFAQLVSRELDGFRRPPGYDELF